MNRIIEWIRGRYRDDSHSQNAGVHKAKGGRADYLHAKRPQIGVSSSREGTAGTWTLLNEGDDRRYIHVDGKRGNDDNPGTAKQPLRTVQEAADRVALFQRRRQTITIHPGSYGDLVLKPMIAGGWERGVLLEITSATENKDDVEVNSIVVENHTGMHHPVIEHLTVTGVVDYGYESRSGILFAACNGFNLRDVAFTDTGEGYENVPPGEVSRAVELYYSTGRMKGDLDLGAGREWGIACKHGSTADIQSTVAGAPDGTALVAREGSRVTVADDEFHAVGGMDTSSGGVIIDRNSHTIISGPERAD